MRIACLYATALLVGFAYGMMWSVTPANVSDLFGTAKFSTLWGWHIVAPAVAGSLMNAFAGFVYDVHAGGAGSSGDRYCYGAACYRLTLLTCAGCGVVATGLGMLLGPHTKCARAEAKRGT